MPNLDRFSQPLHGETYFEDEKPVCQCAECENDLFEGEWHYEADGQFFCDVDCFLEWCKVEFDGRSKILERD